MERRAHRGEGGGGNRALFMVHFTDPDLAIAGLSERGLVSDPGGEKSRTGEGAQGTIEPPLQKKVVKYFYVKLILKSILFPLKFQISTTQFLSLSSQAIYLFVSFLRSPHVRCNRVGLYMSRLICGSYTSFHACVSKDNYIQLEQHLTFKSFELIPNKA